VDGKELQAKHLPT